MAALTRKTGDFDIFSSYKESFERIFVPPETLDKPCDVILVIEDGLKKLKAHKDVLSEASLFFEKLLNSDMKESNEGVIRLEMFSESVMAATLEFIYTGRVLILTLELAQGLIVMADYLFLPKLNTLAEEIIMQKLNASNCISTYYLAERLERHRFKELVSKTKQFILENFSAVAKTEEFLNLSNKEVKMWISSDEINVSAEEDIFKIILTWIEHDKDERNKHFADLFRQVRLAYVSRDFLSSDILTTDLVKTDKACLSFVMDAVEPPNSKKRQNLSIIPRASQQCPCIVACVFKYILLYFPREDKWCVLGEALPDLVSNLSECEVFSCRGKLYFLKLTNTARRYVDSESVLYLNVPAAMRMVCYDPLSNCWSQRQLMDDCHRYVKQIFINNDDEVYALVSYFCDNCENLSCLCYDAAKKRVSFLMRYTPESNEWEEISSFNFGAREGICIVAKDRFIYFIGGGVREQHVFKYTSGVDRYDLNLNKWDRVADVQEGRMFTCGAATRDRLFIAGGLKRDGTKSPSNTCEMYNEATNEWHFIASLIARPNVFSSMVCCDGKVYVLGGCNDDSSNQTVQCYDPDMDEWKEKTELPIRIPLTPRGRYYTHACSMRIFSRSLSNLPTTFLSRSDRRGDKHKCVTM